jgi:hypothetical protein
VQITNVSRLTEVHMLLVNVKQSQSEIAVIEDENTKCFQMEFPCLYTPSCALHAVFGDWWNVRLAYSKRRDERGLFEGVEHPTLRHGPTILKFYTRATPFIINNYYYYKIGPRCY